MAQAPAEPIDGQPFKEARDQCGCAEMMRRLTASDPSGWIGWYLDDKGRRQYFSIEFWRTPQGRRTFDTGEFDPSWTEIIHVSNLMRSMEPCPPSPYL
jgi:hypothetical protein